MGSDVAIRTVREFNRFWTGKIGLLRSGLLDTPYSLTEARVIFELAQHDRTDLADLRRELDLDAGYSSRILKRLETDGLATTTTSPADARRKVIALTQAGKEAFEDLDGRSAAQIGALLQDLRAEDRHRLVSAMLAIRDVFSATPADEPYLIRPPEPGDLGWVVYRHGAVYAEEYGWNEEFEALVARIVADYVEQRRRRPRDRVEQRRRRPRDPVEQRRRRPRGRGDGQVPDRTNAWIAERDGQPVGCVFCVEKDATVAQLRLLLVEPKARGLGIGGRLVTECIRFATRAGYRQMVLWTNDVLVSARRIYEAAGFELVEEEAHHSFGHDLVGQYWSLDLGAAPPTQT